MAGKEPMVRLSDALKSLEAKVLSGSRRGSPPVVSHACKTCRWSEAVPYQPHGMILLRCNAGHGTHMPDHYCGDYEREPGSDG